MMGMRLTMRKKRNYGLGALIITLLLSITILTLDGVKSSAATNPATTDLSTISSPTQPVYSSWPIYTNSEYGFSFNYPSDWVLSDEVPMNSKTSATKQEFSVGLKLNTETKYSNTVDVEVFDEPLSSAESWYDQYFSQTSIKVNKVSGTLKGKQSILYDFTAPTYESKRYLLAVGSKTYLFSSVNESLNVSTSSDYWSNFDNVFNSLTIRD